MGFSSQAGALIFKQQAAAGTFDPAFATTNIAMPIKSGALATSRELMVPDDEIGGGRDVLNALLGPSSWSGDYEFYARVNSLLTLLKAGFGTEATPVTTTGVTTHTFTPSDAAQLPFLSIQERIGNGLETFNYTDAVVNALHLEADAGGYLQGTVGMIAKMQTAGATPVAAPSWDATPLIVGTNVSLTYNGVALPAKSFSMDFANNFDDDDYRLGSFFISDLTPKRRDVTAGFTIRETSSALWRQAVNGAASATVAGGQTVNAPLVINCTSYETISGSTPPTAYSLQITFPNFLLSPYTFAVSGSDIIDDDLEGRAIRPAANVPICTVVVKTGLAVTV
jgi:hypothetical protein